MPLCNQPRSRPSLLGTRLRFVGHRHRPEPDDEQQRPHGHGGGGRDRNSGPVPGDQHPCHRRAQEGRGPEGPAAHHIGGGELVGRLDHGGEHGCLRWPRRGEAQCGQRSEYEDDDDRRVQSDRYGYTSHGQSLEGVAPAEHVVCAVLVRQCTQEGPEQDARHQLSEHHDGSR